MTHSSPSSTAVVFRLARSDPESGSEKPWHQRISPRRILGRNSCFCSSLPHCRIVGPTSVSPKKSARSGALTRANSSASTTPCIVDSPLPPYSTGHVAQIQPPANSLRGHDSLNCRRCSARQLERLAALGRVDPARRAGCRRASHGSRARNASASASYVSSDVPTIGSYVAERRNGGDPRRSLCCGHDGDCVDAGSALDGAMEGALRRGHHDRAVHRVRRLRRHLPPRRHRLRARRGQVHPVPPRGRARPGQLHPRREGLHDVHPGVPAVPGLGAGRRPPPVRPGA